MYSRTGINDMLAELADDMPRLLNDPDTFFRKFDDRTMQSLAATAPGAHIHVREVLDGFFARRGIDDCYAA